MKVSYQWLNEFVQTDLSLKALSEQLTLAGLEVDSVEPVAAEFSKVVVGEVINKHKHPDADKLSCCKVNVGDEVLDIVCGAANVIEGMKVAVALVGAKLPAVEIKKSKLRGQSSNGMLCSERELGLSDEHNGIMALADNAPIGEDVRHYLQLDDTSIEVDLTPNRADCLSVEGIAREVAALNRLVYKPVDIKPIAAEISEHIEIELRDVYSCPKYVGRIVHNVDAMAKSPLWMTEKLRRCGIRPISIIVDITNYVMLEIGQPMHAFDLNKIEGGIVVRMADESEKLTLLDGNEITLTNDTLVIADHQKALALAGIMGGEASAVTDNTKDILLESAFFLPIAIAGKARSYGLHTDSSHRFERGVDPALAERAIERATELLVDLACGTASDVIIKSDSKYLPKKETILLNRARINRLLGLEITADEIVSILTALGFRVKNIHDTEKWQIEVPSWRFDISIEEDLIEEIARLYGYENLPQTLPDMSIPIVKIQESAMDSLKVKNLLISRGYQEAITYSFIDPKFDCFFASHHKSLALKNPIASDMAVMRQSLIPGLLVSLKNNMHRQQSRIRNFEVGNCFIYNEKGELEQKQMLAGIVSGMLTPLQWSKMSESDFYDVKSDVAMLLSITREQFGFKPIKNLPYLHSGRSAVIVNQAGEQVGVIGQIHPNLQKLVSLKGKAPIIFELNWEKLDQIKLPKFSNWSKYPSISRDIAIVVDENIAVETIRQSIIDAGGELLLDVGVFDLYQGDNLPKNKKSVAFNLILQDSSKTLKDEDINQVVDQLVAQLEENYKATLRE
ncbi:phenylalanine--tRNA ligase subunit beta [Thiotrichales bacterium 19S3-7]|nr:phenylalanine--tRNA ligase subunit beta [Thiotrichales bacterium 19S3-7]MCF6801191.1 phenylalanine--tRNA ligase subunit beta [Thiotrichales bacterium 19S3-11]